MDAPVTKTQIATIMTIIDLSTGEVIEFMDEEIEALQEKIAQKLGYTLKGHRMELYGVPLNKKAKT